MLNTASEQTVYIVDDDAAVRRALQMLVKSDGLPSRSFPSAGEFLAAIDEIGPGCLLLDVCMPEMTGIELQHELIERRFDIPTIVMTGHADVPTAVAAMKRGAVDFIEKPFDGDELLCRTRECLNTEQRQREQIQRRKLAAERLARLTPRESQIMECLVAGRRNKQIAEDLFISARTVELHRASIMDKLEANTLSDIVRTALLADHF